MQVGAGNEARTRYLHLGKVALYQMSYARETNCIITALPRFVNPPSANFLHWQALLLGYTRPQGLKRLVKDFLILFTEYSKNRQSKSRGLMAPGLLMRCLLVSHHLADFLVEHNPERETGGRP